MPYTSHSFLLLRREIPFIDEKENEAKNFTVNLPLNFNLRGPKKCVVGCFDTPVLACRGGCERNLG